MECDTGPLPQDSGWLCGWYSFIAELWEILKSAYHLRNVFHFIYSPKSSEYIVFRTTELKNPLFLLLSLKRGKSSHTLIHYRAMKGNGFDTRLTSQINVHRCFSRKQQNAKQSATKCIWTISEIK